MSVLEAVHPSVERDALEGFEAVTLAAGALEATFVPSVGMVAGSLRHAGRSCWTDVLACGLSATEVR